MKKLRIFNRNNHRLLSKIKIINICLVLTLFTNSCLLSKTSDIKKENKLAFHLHKNCNKIILFFDDLDKETREEKPEIIYANSNYEGVIGALSGVFLTNYKCTKKILKNSTNYSQFIKFILLKSLLYSKFDEKTLNEFIFKNNFHQYLENFKNIKDINKIIPNYLPSDNDLLIGIFTTTGNYKYIDAILKNFTNNIKRTEIITDSFRFGNSILMFGDQKEKEYYILTEIQDSIKKKYYKKDDHFLFFKILTLSTAIWTVKSLSLENEDLKKHIYKFMESNNLKEYFVKEEVIASNLQVLLRLNKMYEEILKTNNSEKQIKNIKKIKSLINKFIKEFYTLQYPNEKLILNQKIMLD
jgi:hypothetical protein